jgi:hypothetical protein
MPVVDTHLRGNLCIYTPVDVYKNIHTPFLAIEKKGGSTGMSTSRKMRTLQIK